MQFSLENLNASVDLNTVYCLQKEINNNAMFTCSHWGVQVLRTRKSPFLTQGEKKNLYQLNLRGESLLQHQLPKII